MERIAELRPNSIDERLGRLLMRDSASTVTAALGRPEARWCELRDHDLDVMTRRFQ